MNAIFRNGILFGSWIFSVLLVSHLAIASDVEARLSTREAYVGSPVILQIAVNNAKDITPPQIPEIEGVDVQSLGAPSQSTQTTIINGRYSSKRSLVYLFQLTPRSVGEYEVPEFEIEADGQTHTISSMRFVATKSETGDLLFVEVTGDMDEAYVGQPVNLTLNIWIKPFLIKDRNATLSEYSMWNCISDQSRWGPFRERLQNLINNGQRPGGEEVLRKDGNGDQRNYYRYQIDAVVYPDRPGKIDLDDVKVVVDYPTEVGRRNRGIMGSGMFGDDDFFSGFSSPLAITKVRPIEANAPLASTNILPVPTDGQPADYQGAVGKYNIQLHALQKEVQVGEPVPLIIQIAGTGPMDLVQAPRLDQVKALTDRFRVGSESLAGISEGQLKQFETTIRPRKEGTVQIPEIPFSFFDPDTRQYRTVYTDPISINVLPAQTLALDDVVSQSEAPQSTENSVTPPMTLPSLSDWELPRWGTQPDFENSLEPEMLTSSVVRQTGHYYWLWLILPLVYVAGFLYRWMRGEMVLGGAWSRKTVESLDSADTILQMRGAVATTVLDSCKIPASEMPRGDLTLQAIGRLRLMGLYPLAARLESWFDRSETAMESQLAALRSEAEVLISEVVRQVPRRRPAAGQVKSSVARLAGAGGRAARLLIGWGLLAISLLGNGSLALGAIEVGAAELSGETAEQVLREATQLYQATLHDSDLPDSQKQDRFLQAAEKYQQLLDSGIANRAILLASGNAYFQAGKKGQAIACYEQALKNSPNDAQVQANLAHVRSQVESPETPVGSWLQQGVGQNDPWWIDGLVGVCWTGFWLVLIGRQWGLRLPVSAALLLFLGGIAMWGWSAQRMPQPHAIVVADTLQLYAGDGKSFPVVAQWDDVDGWELPVLERRPGWVKVSGRGGKIGWTPETAFRRLPEMPTPEQG